jgi:tetratricopeptide (TPR) repeat protein
MPRRIAILAVLAAPAVAAAQSVRTGDSGSGSSVGVIEEDPRKEIDRMRQGALRHMGQAEKHMLKGRTAAAWASLRSARTLLVDKALAQRWSDMATTVHREVTGMLEEADAAFRRAEYVEAIEAYEQINRSFGGLPMAKTARRRLEDAKEDPSVQAAMKEGRAVTMFAGVDRLIQRQRRKLADAQAESSGRAGPTATAPATRPAEKPLPEKIAAMKPLDVIRSMDDEHFLDAVGRLERLAKACKPAPTALKAADWVARLRKDKATNARIARLRQGKQAENDLARAEMYDKAGMLRKAAELYEQVVKDHPESPLAAKASRRLGRIKAKMAKRATPR